MFSLLHKRFQCRQATLLPTKCGGALRDDTENGCVADYQMFRSFTNGENTDKSMGYGRHVAIIK